MSAPVLNTNAACCSIPPVLSDYTPKGSFQSYASFKKVYVTGQSSNNALVCVYDIFGFWPQTQQGADTLAATLNAKVLMPDFFEPADAFPIERFPPSTDEDKNLLQAFFGGPANVQKTVSKLTAVGDALKKDGFKHVAAYGFCWGGKVTILAGSSTVFDAVAATHPAMVSASDAENLSVPLGFFPSNDEDLAECEKLIKVASGKPFASKNLSKVYTTMFHGFAAARANLKDEENKKQFADLYSTLAGFVNGVWTE